jgi:pyruvate,orthophosphate dikinase
MFPSFDTSANVTPVAAGVSASPGAAIGKAVFDSARAVELAAAGAGGHFGPP